MEVEGKFYDEHEVNEVKEEIKVRKKLRNGGREEY